MFESSGGGDQEPVSAAGRVELHTTTATTATHKKRIKQKKRVLIDQWDEYYVCSAHAAQKKSRIIMETSAVRVKSRLNQNLNDSPTPYILAYT